MQMKRNAGISRLGNKIGLALSQYDVCRDMEHAEIIQESVELMGEELIAMSTGIGRRCGTDMCGVSVLVTIDEYGRCCYSIEYGDFEVRKEGFIDFIVG